MGFFSGAKEVEPCQDFHRICQAPRRPWPYPEAEVQRLCKEMTEVLRTANGTETLRPLQAIALWEIGTYHCLLGPLRVGSGKTLISFLGPYVLDCHRPMLFLPASLVDKTKREMDKARKHWRIPTNIQIESYQKLGRAGAADAMKFWAPDCFIFDECHFLKNRKAAVTKRVARHMAEIIGKKFPVIAVSGTIITTSISDTAHVAGWTHGEKSPYPRDKGFLYEVCAAVDEVPAGKPGAGGGGNVFMGMGCLRELATHPEDQKDTDLATARAGLRRRLLETPGVVASGFDGGFAGSLYVTPIRYRVPPVTEGYFKTLRKEWLTPDGWPLKESIEVWQCVRQLALGLHYVWFNIEGFRKCLLETLSKKDGRIGPIEQKILSVCVRMTEHGPLTAALGKRKAGYSKQGTESTLSNLNVFAQNTTTHVGSVVKQDSDLGSTIVTSPGGSEESFAYLATAQSGSWETLLNRYPKLSSILEVAIRAARPPEDWLAYRKEYFRFVRDVLSDSEIYDSEKQVRDACLDGRLPRDDFDRWAAVADLFTPNSKPVWHDTTALELCEKWMAAPENKKGLVWVEHSFFGRELSRRSGVPYFGRKGLDSKGVYVEDHDGPAIVSRAANSTGRNLQLKWSQNLITAPSSNGAIWEQLLGRTHRDGQPDDSVSVEVLLGCWEHFDAIRRARDSGRMLEDTLGQSQKICLADLDWPLESEVKAMPGACWIKNKDIGKLVESGE